MSLSVHVKHVLEHAHSWGAMLLIMQISMRAEDGSDKAANHCAQQGLLNVVSEEKHANHTKPTCIAQLHDGTQAGWHQYGKPLMSQSRSVHFA